MTNTHDISDTVYIHSHLWLINVDNSHNYLFFGDGRKLRNEEETYMRMGRT